MRALQLLLSALMCMLIAMPANALHAPAATTPGALDWAYTWSRSETHDVTDRVPSAALCAIGDINRDGAQDLLIRTKSEAGARLDALAGPDHVDVLWTAVVDAAIRLQCAPDALGDGIGDPVLILRDQAGSTLPGGEAPLSASDATTTLETLDGATGKRLFEVIAQETARSGDASVATGGTRTDVALEPGAVDLYLFVERESTGLGAFLADQLSLSGQRANVRIELLDATGAVQGVIEAEDASEILAHATIADAQGARVLVLSAADALPLDQASAQVPTIAAFATDGTLLWSSELEATTDEILLVPQAGDINGDGIEDLIVETLSTDVGMPDGSVVNVLSGADGTVLLSKVTETGFLAALPLGNARAIADEASVDAKAKAESILLISQEAPDAPVMLECIHQDVSCWTAELPAGAVPVNGATDPFTGDLVGFHDLTGDGIPDVAALVESASGQEIRVVSGINGALAWTTTIDEGASALPIPTAKGADLAVLDHAENARSVTLTLLDGTTGEVRWAIETQIASEIEDAHAALDVVTDANGNARSIILTLASAASVHGDDHGADLPTEHVYMIDPATGGTTWAGSTLEGAPAPPELLTVASVEGGSSAVPGPGAALVVAAVATIALALGARKRRG